MGIVGIVAFIGVLIVLGFVARAAMVRVVKLRRDRRRAKYRNVPLPQLVIPTFPSAAYILPAGINRDLQPMVAEAGTSEVMASEAVAASAAVSPIAVAPIAVPQPEETPTPEMEVPTPLPPAKRRRAANRPRFERERKLERWMEPLAPHPEPIAVVADATTAFKRPRNEHVQVLPGRLQILSGDAAGKDLRLFSRAGEKPRIVVGREAGPAHRCITLRSATVSRRHARMEFIDGHWTITNLSQTNPVLVNDHALTDPSSVTTLANGDRIELGEVALRFLAS